MKLIDVVTGPWAIQPEKLLEIQAIYATHLRGDKIDLEAVEKRLGRPLNNEPKGYQIIDGVAVLPVNGVLGKRANLLTQVSGMASTELLGNDFKSALNDQSITGIVLSVDSPGGTVDGTQTLASIVASARGIKPVVTLASGCMCSAAYWIGASAAELYISSGTDQVGSIGVVAGHKDISKAESIQGVKTTEITAGKYKRVSSQYEPLSESGRANIQETVDYLYSIFVADVAQARGVSTETVLNDMADGRVFIGQQAIDAGLVDGVSTLEGAIARVQQLAAGVAAKSTFNAKGDPTMDRATLLAAHPELVESIRAEGADAERARILAVESQSMPGHEKLIASFKADGKTSAAEAAMQVLAAEKGKLSSMAAALASDAPAPVAHANAPVDAETAPKNDRENLHAKAKAYMADHPGTDLMAALRAVQAK
jgi:signal peptide peptidase SppA